MSYSIDLRKRAVASVNRGDSIAATARLFGVQRSTVRDWCRRAEDGGLVPGKPGPTGPVKLTAADDRVLLDAVAERPGVTAKEVLPRLSVAVAESTVCRAWKRLGLTRKKSR